MHRALLAHVRPKRPRYISCWSDARHAHRAGRAELLDRRRRCLLAAIGRKRDPPTTLIVLSDPEHSEHATHAASPRPFGFNPRVGRRAPPGANLFAPNSELSDATQTKR